MSEATATEVIADAWCSWCFERTCHDPTDAGKVLGWPVTIFACRGCNQPTMKCVANCGKMACASDDVDHLLCATHRGEIASFEAQSEKIADPTDFAKIFEPRDGGTATDSNISSIAKKAASLVLGAAVGGVAFRVLGAAHAGAKGAALGYKGAVATKVGWAKLGGGALTKGGWGIAGGKARLATTFVGKGTWRSWTLANTYFADLQGFRIRKVRDGIDPALICINGFRTEEKDEAAAVRADRDWIDGLGGHFPDRALYRVQWPATKSDGLVHDAFRLGGNLLSQLGTLSAARSASRAAARAARIPALAGAVGNDVLDTSWPLAVANAKKSAFLLAEVISRCENRSFILMGHSLGARMSVIALRRLAKRSHARPTSRVEDVYLFGGAINAETPEFWLPLQSAISGKCYSFRTSKDTDLGVWYRLGTGTVQDQPIGRCAIPTNEATASTFVSHDVSDVVAGHTDYHRNLSALLTVARLR
jgi:Protein of unknown function (DUF726)